MPLIPELGRGKGRLISEFESSLGYGKRTPGQSKLRLVDWAVEKQHPRSLLWTVQQREGITSYSWTERWYYYIQLNEEADNWQEHSLQRTVSIGSSLRAMGIRRREQQTLFAYTINISTQIRKEWYYSMNLDQGRHCHFPTGLRLWSLIWPAHIINNTHHLILHLLPTKRTSNPSTF